VAALLDTDMNIGSSGQDAAGELYVLDYAGGTIYHLTGSAVTGRAHRVREGVDFLFFFTYNQSCFEVGQASWPQRSYG
jgi:hypothetical protein